MFRLDNRVILITGASRGIGKAAALAVARRGATAWVSARSLDACDAVAEEIRSFGGTARVAACDVTDFEAVERMVAQVYEQDGRLDALVNNAGTVEPIGFVHELDPAAWAKCIEVNLSGAFHCCRSVLPRMIEAGGGVIVNVSSGAAHRPKEGWAAYCASKAGLAMLTRSIDLEARRLGIRVYGFQPGVVDTEMQSIIRRSGINEVSRLRRDQLAHPDEPAHIIAWLCSDEAADLAGQELTIRDDGLRRRSGLREYTGV